MAGEPELARRKEEAKTGAKGQETRAQDVINAGVEASYQLPTLKRSIELLDSVKTGGFQAAALRAKQIFGIEAADEGELSSNLGKSVLSQLRDTFGAAFTEKEGERLARIEANFGKNPETNKRLLNNIIKLAERKVDNALTRAKERGDDETVAELESNLEFSLSPDAAAPAAVPAAITDLSLIHI